MKDKSTLLIPCIMAVANSGCMSLVMCLLNVGLGPHFWGEFFRSFLIGMAVTLPISYAFPVLLNKKLPRKKEEESR